MSTIILKLGILVIIIVAVIINLMKLFNHKKKVTVKSVSTTLIRGVGIALAVPLFFTVVTVGVLFFSAKEAAEKTAIVITAKTGETYKAKKLLSVHDGIVEFIQEDANKNAIEYQSINTEGVEK